MNQTDYCSYDELELYQLINETWEITDRPYLLHAAYALSCLAEAVENDEGENKNDNWIWGKTIPERILKIVVKNAAENFNDAAENGTRIDVFGRSYSIRKVNAYDHERLVKIFDFPYKDGEYTITQDGVKKLSEHEHFNYQKNKECFNANKSFLRKVIMVAEDDENDGWDKLTDMEVAVYCWARFYHKYQCDNEVQFAEKYKDYLYVSMQDIHNCMNEYSTMTRRLHGMYAFDCIKVMEWNKENKQRSVIECVPEKEAEDYWYNVALKKTFKPIP